MTKSKKWYQSKIVWVGIFQVVYGTIMQIAEFIEAGVYSPTAIASVVMGCMLVIFRVYFTDHQIEV